jgi:hypothetical protein
MNAKKIGIARMGSGVVVTVVLPLWERGMAKRVLAQTEARSSDLSVN